MLPGLETIATYIDIDGDEINLDEEPIFLACEARGLDVERLVFTQTALIQPFLKYLTEDLIKDPSLELRSTQEEAVAEIRNIFERGIYSRLESEVGTFEVSALQALMASRLYMHMTGQPRTARNQESISSLPDDPIETIVYTGDPIKPLTYKGFLHEVVESHVGSILDFVAGNIGRGSKDGSLENLQSPVVVAFHLDRLETIDEGTFKIRHPRRDAVAAIIGLYLSKLHI